MTNLNNSSRRFSPEDEAKTLQTSVLTPTGNWKLN